MNAWHPIIWSNKLTQSPTVMAVLREQQADYLRRTSDGWGKKKKTSTKIKIKLHHFISDYLWKLRIILVPLENVAEAIFSTTVINIWYCRLSHVTCFSFLYSCCRVWLSHGFFVFCLSHLSNIHLTVSSFPHSKSCTFLWFCQSLYIIKWIHVNRVRQLYFMFATIKLKQIFFSENILRL